MKAAYADPPYIDQAKRHYQCEEINYPQLLAKLTTEYDAWALSASSPSLRYLLPLCPEDVRIAAWVKPFAIFKPNVNPAYAWEPVLYQPLPRKHPRTEKTVRDWVSCNITLRRGLVGVKPENFCLWLFSLLGLQPDDEFVDLFPGSGAVTKAWEKWKANQSPTAPPPSQPPA